MTETPVTDRDNLNDCTNKFIELANKLREEGQEVQLVSAALMAASGIYATFTAAGNSGALVLTLETDPSRITAGP